MNFIILRRRTQDEHEEYYAGHAAWSTSELEAHSFTPEVASVLCERFLTKFGAQYAEIVFRAVQS